MSKSPSIYHSYGTLTGYFAVPEKVTEALSKQLRPVSSWRKWNVRDIIPVTESGFQPASEIRSGIHLHNSDRNPGPSCSIRYITFPGTPQRNISPAKFEQIICQSLIALQDLGSFPGLTIIEDSVLIPILKEEGPIMVGTLLREMASGTGGVIVLGKVWVPPVSEMDPYFDRVVWTYDIPMIMEMNNSTKPDFGQATIGD